MTKWWSKESRWLTTTCFPSWRWLRISSTSSTSRALVLRPGRLPHPKPPLAVRRRRQISRSRRRQSSRSRRHHSRLLKLTLRCRLHLNRRTFSWHRLPEQKKIEQICSPVWVKTFTRLNFAHFFLVINWNYLSQKTVFNLYWDALKRHGSKRISRRLIWHVYSYFPEILLQCDSFQFLLKQSVIVYPPYVVTLIENICDHL